MIKNSPQYKAPAIERAARLIGLLAESSGDSSLSALARALGVGKSSLLGVLRGLEEVGWVERAGKGYRLGPDFVALSRKVAVVPDVALLAAPYLSSLAEKLGKSVCLGRRSGDRVVIEACAEAAGNLRIALRPGMSVPFLAAATGKALLSTLDDEEARAALPAEMPRFTPRSPVDQDVFIAGVRIARLEGFATDDEEYLRGVRAVAAPLPTGEKTTMVLWAVGFADGFSDSAMREAGAMLSSTAKKISSLLKNPALA